ncbi:alginate export family protein [Acinetobacter tjernbergiae]|uniref:Alginate export domain-containing protein n=1 Tax=Acinetobacter tjernbergiae DSM 14971 = CIP 107465 TaxID=1120928 RepID=V2UHT2_9GAMM|nr:alginate export family protein [Acinetobacter tjernbergiae]ESK54263.1 hypothetical protein F990_02813 [Acinetobacter tjernbergiae DSM 14971 = CIP 107465]
MKLNLLSLAMLSLLSTATFAADDFLTKTKFSLDSRLRYELVDQDNQLKNADAWTLRLRPSLETGTWHGLSAFVQGEGTVEINDNFNSTRNAETNYSTVTDPENLQLNQAYLKYVYSPKFDLNVGRQVINLDNQRFVGSVAWRQNDQTFDAISLNIKPYAKFGLYYAYIDQVNTIFGSDDPKPKFVRAQDGKQDSQIHLIQAKVNYSPLLNSTFYGYLMDFEDLAAWSNQTYGLRLTGKKNNFRYVAEYAKQSEYADQPTNYDADYYALELGYGITDKGSALGEIALGYEVLGSDAGKIAFQTPLATKHKFNGWADLFLTTPVNGLTDLYISSNFNVFGKGKLSTELHQYRSDVKNMDYGQEFSVSYSHALPVKGLSALAKFSDYQAEEFSVDTQKLWFQVDYKY